MSTNYDIEKNSNKCSRSTKRKITKHLWNEDGKKRIKVEKQWSFLITCDRHDERKYIELHERKNENVC